MTPVPAPADPVPEPWRGLVDDAAIFPPGDAPLHDATAAHAERRGAGRPTWSAPSCSATPTCRSSAGSPRRCRSWSPAAPARSPARSAWRPGSDCTSRPRDRRCATSTTSSATSAASMPRCATAEGSTYPSHRAAPARPPAAGSPPPTRSRPPGTGSSSASATSTTTWSPTRPPSPPGSTPRSTARRPSRARPACTAPYATTPEGGGTHGFLNVMVATADAVGRRLGRRRDRAPSSSATAPPWPPLDRRRRRRGARWFTSFGSCSVDEPLDDLIALGLAPPTTPH